MTRPYLGYWPDPDEAPATEPQRDPVYVVSRGGAVVRGIFWTPPAGTPWKTAVVLTHPRGDFSVHYVAPQLTAAGFAVLGGATRYVNNDSDCLHENCVWDVEAMVAEARRRGAQNVILLGNSGGGSLMALSEATAQRERGEHLGDGFVALAAHPGEGVFMLQVIDPSVTDENDPFSCDPSLDMYNPDNGWKPWPNESSYDPVVVCRLSRCATRPCGAGRSDRARRDCGACRSCTRGRLRAMHVRYITTYRTLADPAYLDLSIDPDQRPLGSIFAPGDPRIGNYGYGLARTMTPRGWLSTWSGLSSHAALAETMPEVTIPSLFVHPTADSEIRLHQARAAYDASGAIDKEYVEIEGAAHYFAGRQRDACAPIISWLEKRF